MSAPEGAPAHDHDVWVGTLDELEAGLDRLEAALDADEPPDATAWSPPVGLGPLPVSLRERAADLLARLQDVTDEVRAARSLSFEEVQRTRQRRDAAAAYHAAG